VSNPLENPHRNQLVYFEVRCFLIWPHESGCIVRNDERDHLVIEPGTVVQYVFFTLLFRIVAIHVGGETYVEVAIGNVVEFYVERYFRTLTRASAQCRTSW
jgi:hypothetical protein